jgi:hypothetical protein
MLGKSYQMLPHTTWKLSRISEVDQNDAYAAYLNVGLVVLVLYIHISSHTTHSTWAFVRGFKNLLLWVRNSHGFDK